MKHQLKRWLAAFAAVLLLVGSLTGVEAKAELVTWTNGFSVDAESMIVIEANTGTVLYEKKADTAHYPASITKIMTTLLALENSALDEVVTFSTNAVYLNEGSSSHIARDIGEEMTMEQCLYAVMLESANECAYAVAEHVGGDDYDAFIEMMNEKATALGCTNTNFTNANGLPDESHTTSCRDMALIAQAAIANSTFRQIISTVKYTIPATNKHEDETYLNNHHRMINNYKGSTYLYEYAIGGKTGYTVAAGNTLVTYAEKDGMLLICVLMSSASPYDDTIKAFDYCFENYTLYNISDNETRYDDTQLGTSAQFATAEAFAALDTTAGIVLPVGASFADTEVEISYENVSEDVLGTLVYTYNGRTVGSADLLITGASAATYSFEETDGSAAEDEATTESEDSGHALATTASGLTNRASSINLKRVLLLLALIVAAVLVLLFVISRIRHYIRRKRRRERRYKIIKQNKKWRRRSRRRW